MIVLITEKPSHTKALAPTAAEKWPGQKIYALHTHRHSHTVFRYPRGLQWKDYPRTELVNSQIRRDASWSIARIGEGGKVIPTRASVRPDRVDGQTATTRLLSDAEHIVYACEPDPIGAVCYFELLSALLGPTRADEERAAVFVRDYSAEAVERAFAQGDSTESASFRFWLNYGRTKRYFDFNFALNSLAILGATFESASGVSARVPISKYALQTLYIVRNSMPMSPSSLIHTMQSWKGTGRYLQPSIAVGIGSPLSRGRILDDLAENGLIVCQPMARETSMTVQLTELGRRFMDALHPDCEDPDLPFRLDSWCSEGIAISGAKTNTYIRTFFGKQKRFIDGLHRAKVDISCGNE